MPFCSPCHGCQGDTQGPGILPASSAPAASLALSRASLIGCVSSGPGPSRAFIFLRLRARGKEGGKGRKERGERLVVGLWSSPHLGLAALPPSNLTKEPQGELTPEGAGVVEAKDKLCRTAILGVLDRQPRCIRHVYQTRRPHSSSEQHGDVGYRSVNL